MFVYRVEPIDLFDDLTPLHRYLADGGSSATRWALTAVLALADSGVGWEGDMRHLPHVGHLPCPPGTSPYLVVKQDNNGDTFIISSIPLAWIEHDYPDAKTQVPTRDIGRWDERAENPHPDEMPF
jgi:hypothetical protein